MTDTHADVTREDGALMKFLIKRALQASSPLCKGQMCEEYKEATGSKVPERDLRKRFVTILAPKIGNINNYDAAVLAKLYFVTSTPVNEKFLKRLQEHNIVELDNAKRIIKLVGKKMKFEGVHCFGDKVDRYNEYKAKTGNFSEYCKPTEGGSLEAMNSAPSTSSRNIGSKSVATKHIDTNTKTKALSAPTNSRSGKDRSLKKEKRRKRQKKSCSDQFTDSPSIECLSAIVTIKSENSEDSALSEYKMSSDSNHEEDSIDSHNSMNFEIFRYLAIKANNVQQPLELSTLWRDFVVETKTNSSPSDVESRFQQSLAPKIHTLREFDLETRVRMLFASSTPVERKFLKELKKDAVVELDNNDRIIKYKSNKTGGLKLGGGEIIGSKTKKRRRRVFEESEDSDDDLFPCGITNEKKSEGFVVNYSILFCLINSYRGKKKRKVVVYLSSDEDTGLDEIEEKSKISSQTQNLTPSIHDVKSEVETNIAPDASEIPSETRFDQELYITDNKATLETQVSLGTTMATDLYTIEETPINEQPKDVSTEKNMPLQIVPVTEQQIFPMSNNEIELSNIFLGSPAFSHYHQGGIPSRPPSQNTYFGSEMFSMQSISSLPQFDLTPSPMNQLSLYSPPFFESNSLPMFSNPGPDSITLKDCLKLLKILVISLETPLLHGLSEQIKQTIEKIGDDDEKLLMSDVLPVAKAAFFGLSRKFRAQTSEDHPNMTKNVKEFSKIFKCFLLGLESPSLDELLNEVKTISDNTESCDQIVMISDIQQAIQSILSTFSR
ncbi:hypothetical protein CRE_11817 [Caenorhabditis remanei]|uniref:SPK domain-containing protein n=1 Tax=Caenorhabditis remanei TaxID=31234 RepID=E3M4V1_CAERE|nr:hypothetical protein CRE_11817 [Caenorhabditis remanei]